MQIEILDVGKAQLLTFLKITQKHQEQIAVIPRTDEIDFKFIDPSNTSAGHLKFKDGTHCKIDDLEPELNGKQFELNVKDVIRILSHLKNQTASMNTEVDDAILVGISFDIKNKDTNETDKSIQIPMYVAEQKVEFDEVKYQNSVANISLPLADFADAIGEAVEYSTEIMHLSIAKQENGTIHFIINSVDSDNLRKNIRIIKKQDTDFKIVKDNIPENMTVLYNIALLNSLILQASEYSQLILTFAEASPLTIIYHNEADFNLKCILAHANLKPNMD